MARRWLFLVVAVVGGFSALLGACGPTSPTPTPFPTLAPTPTPNELPEFVLYTFPRPGAMVEQWECTTRNNWATLDLAVIAEPGETLGLWDMKERVTFLIDGAERQVEIEMGLRNPLIMGRFPLDLGEHEATVRVRRTSGEVLEFSWRFIVVAEEPSMPGLPEVLQFVRPVPDTTITLRQYEEDQLVPEWYLRGVVHQQGGICVGMLTEKLVERYAVTDVRRLSPQDTLQKVSFVALDGAPPGPEADVLGGMEALLISLYDEEHNLVAQFGGPHQWKCWRVDLAPGRHEVAVRVEQPAGQVTEFTWWFVIVED